MFSYRFYGLQVRSDLAIPGLRPAAHSAMPDLHLSFQQTPPELDQVGESDAELWWVSPWKEANGTPQRVIHRLLGGALTRVRYHDGSTFIMDRACRRMWCTWPSTLSLHDVGVYLLGPVMGSLLRLRGIECLHGSAVQIGDDAVVLVGASEAGKSTTAAAFADSGYTVLSDDLAVLCRDGDGYKIEPGYPHLRLCGTAVEWLYGSPDALPLIVGSWDKRRLDLVEANAFALAAARLQCIYVLHERDPHASATRFEAVAPADALILLVANTYSNLMLDSRMRRREFDFLSELVTRVPVRKVVAPDNLELLPRVCQAIAEDVIGLRRPSANVVPAARSIAAR